MGRVNYKLHSVLGCLNHTTKDEATGCLLWMGSKKGQMGYAQFSHKVGIGTRTGHVEVYIYLNGSIPDGYDVGHTCDNPECINPDHLVLQTRKENIQQARDRGRLVSNLDKAVHTPGTAEFSRRVSQGVKASWACMTPEEVADRGRSISRGKRKKTRK